MRRHSALVPIVLLLSAARPGAADVWDSAVPSDDSDSSMNQIVHGARQEHDVAARPGPVADQDWFKVVTEAHSSYEVVVDGATAELGSGTGGLLLGLSRRALDGTILTNGQSATSEFGGLFGAFALGLTWQNTSATASSNHVVVAGAGCGSTCTNGARYTLRLYETTTAVPRFNNSASQISVLMVQNTSPYHAVTGTVWFWSPGGSLVASQAFNVSAHGLYVVNTSGLAGLAGQAGSITITNDGRYGDLGGKAVSIEPATGFSFDSPMAPRAH